MLALREFAQIPNAWEHTFPIIEPVKSAFNGINRAIDELNTRNVSVAIIQNPQVGDLVGCESLIEREIKYLPNCRKAYILRDDLRSIEQNVIKSETECVFILTADTNFEEDDIIRICSLPKVKIVLVCEKYKNIRRKLLRTSSDLKIALLFDNFQARMRNADYLDVEDEMFSDEYFYFSEDKCYGVSDYTVLPSQYSEGGRLPYAVAIHLTYRKGDQVRLHHFISDSNFDTADIQGKFKEAAIKAVEFCNLLGLETNGVNLLKFYVDRGIYPGLGMLKKISIIHHLEIVKSIMEDKSLF